MNITSTKDAGALLKSLRQDNDMTRKELAQLSGVPLRTIYAIENGETSNLGLDRFCALLKAFNVKLEVNSKDYVPYIDKDYKNAVEKVTKGRFLEEVLNDNKGKIS